MHTHFDGYAAGPAITIFDGNDSAFAQLKKTGVVINRMDEDIKIAGP
jgi:hypothetical protein